MSPEFLSAARTVVQNPGLMSQPLEAAPVFLTNLACRRAVFDRFPGFPPPWRENFRSESDRYLKDLGLLVENNDRVMHFSLAYVTRVTYNSGTLHRCAKVDQPADGPTRRAFCLMSELRPGRTTISQKKPGRRYAVGRAAVKSGH